MSSPRNAAQLVLVAVKSHYDEADLWAITRGMATVDGDEKPINLGAPWKEVIPFACKVASMAKLNTFMEDFPMPANPNDDDSSSKQDEDSDAESEFSRR